MSHRVLCPTCRGKGRIPNPKIGDGIPMAYYDPKTGDHFPQVTCETCGGAGWMIQRSDLVRPGS